MHDEEERRRASGVTNRLPGAERKERKKEAKEEQGERACITS
jgi:hypothetical protein